MSYTPAEFKNLLERIRKKRANVRNVEVVVYHRASSKSVKKIDRWVRTGDGKRTAILKDVVVSRSGRANAQIAAIQKAQNKRNPFFLKKGENSKIMRHFKEAIEKIVGDKRIGLSEAATRIGADMARIYREHILKGVNSRGPMTPLSKGYAIRKNLRHGTKQPIMVDSGALLASIAFKIKEVS